MTHFVFIHGGMHASWCWESVAQPLRANGHVVDLVDLPGRPQARPGAEVSLASYADTVASAVRAADEPVVLVAHSLGGTAACVALELVQDLVSRVVFVNALLVQDGEAPLPTLAAVGGGRLLLAEGALAYAADGGTITIASHEAGIASFYNLCDPDRAAAAAARWCPEPLAPLLNPISLDLDAFAAVPKTYIGAREDQAVPWEYQQSSSAAFGAELIELTADHSPFLSATEDFLAVLEST